MSSTPRKPTRYGKPLQLEISFFGDRSLRAVLDAYMSRLPFSLSDATVTDYTERVKWLLREFGDTTDVNSIQYDTFEAVIEKYSGLLLNVTLKKRFTTLMAALKLAKKRRRLTQLPDVPDLKNDGKRRQTFHTISQWEVCRQFVPAGPFRRFYDIGFWTGQHTEDLITMERWMLDPQRPILDETGKEIARGMFWRRNHKNPKCQPCWINMQPEFRLIAIEHLDDISYLDSTKIIGHNWNVRRTFHAAADRAQNAGHDDICRVSPLDLRRSFGTMLTGRKYMDEYIRIAMGHEAQNSQMQGGESTRPTIRTQHYYRVSDALIAGGMPDNG